MSEVVPETTSLAHIKYMTNTVDHNALCGLTTKCYTIYTHVPTNTMFSVEKTVNKICANGLIVIAGLESGIILEDW